MNQSFTTSRSFTASRWTPDNYFKPATITVTDKAIYISQGSMFTGLRERMIPLHHVSSVSIRTGTFFAAVRVQSTGSLNIAWHGFRNEDALAIRDLIYSRMSKTESQ